MQPAESVPNRDELGRFGKGNVANPGGRPKRRRFAEQLLKTLSDGEINGELDLKKLEAVTLALLVAAKAGDVSAIKEIGDRIDGKVPQALVGSDEDPAVKIQIGWAAPEPKK